MWIVLLLALGVGNPNDVGPFPDDPFWGTLVSRAALEQIRAPQFLRLIRFDWADYPGTIVTVLPTEQGAQLAIAVLPNWRVAGATRRTVDVSRDQFAGLRQLVAKGLWAQPPSAPSGLPDITDGTMWYIEGLQDGKKHAIVRHQPNDPNVRAVCTALMKLIGEPSLVPHP